MSEMDQTLVNRIVEAALLASHQPLTVAQLQALFPLDEPAPEGSIQAALEQLQADCETRGVALVELASGWRFQVKTDVHAWVSRLWTERQVKYTRATLETLALIAYRQPITRGEIEQVRGVAVSSNIIKALEEREWIRVVGHRDVPGKPELLATTKGFLDYFGLKRLDELPALSELRDIGELEPQLPFEPSIPAGIASDATDADADVASKAPSDQDTAESDRHGAEVDADFASVPEENHTPDIDDQETISEPDFDNTHEHPTGDDAEPASSEHEKTDEQ